jgi:hypothetical protein
MYSWSLANGLIVTGSCETTCTPVKISIIGTTSTVGTTCSGSVYGNVYPSTSVKSAILDVYLMIMALIAMILF